MKYRVSHDYWGAWSWSTGCHMNIERSLSMRYRVSHDYWEEHDHEVQGVTWLLRSMIMKYRVSHEYWEELEHEVQGVTWLLRGAWAWGTGCHIIIERSLSMRYRVSHDYWEEHDHEVQGVTWLLRELEHMVLGVKLLLRGAWAWGTGCHMIIDRSFSMKYRVSHYNIWWWFFNRQSGEHMEMMEQTKK